MLINAQNINISNKISVDADKVLAKLISIRRQLHANPELAGNEKQTQETIKQYLLALGLQVKTNIYGHSVIGILNGNKKGKAIAWRADMDALPNNFEDNVAFKSKIVNVQHGCGHDVHMAIALGIAEVLASNKKHLKGTVYFIFQPQEETFTGAKAMVKNGLFKLIKPTEIYGLHVTPFASGEILVKPNEMYAYQKGLRLVFNGAVDKPTIALAVNKIKTSLARFKANTTPWDIQKALNPTEGLTVATSIFADYCFTDTNFATYNKNGNTIVDIDVYETQKQNLSSIISTVTTILKHEILTKQISAVSFFKENPTVNNNPLLTQISIDYLNSTFGENTVTNMYGKVPFSNDDFAYFQQQVPGVYFFLGASNFRKGMIAMIHAPNFLVDEECIRVGVKKFASFLASRLN